MVYKKRRLFWHFLMPGAVLFVLMVTPPVALGQEKKGAPDNGKKLEKFISANECGVCHPVHYRQWAGSPHGHAHLSPAFQAFQRKLITKSGGTIAGFCVRCHTPLGTVLGEKPLLPDAERAPISLEGVTCVVCHAIDRLHGLVSGKIPISPEFPFYGPFYGPDEPGAKAGAKDTLIKDAPHPGKRLLALKNSRLCGACHDLISTGQLRIEEAFSEWRHSPWAEEGVSCQDCHMSPDPGRPVPRAEWPKGTIADSAIFPDLPKRTLTSHSFVGPDHQLVTNAAKERLDLNDEEYKAYIDKYEKDRLQLFKNAADLSVEQPSEVTPGETLRVVATITNRFSGHNLPTGFTAERQIWLEVLLRDARGKLLYASGDLDKNGDLRDAHSLEVEHGTVPVDYDLTNLQAKFISRGFTGTETENLDPVNRLLTPVPIHRPSSALVALIGAPFSARIIKKGILARSSQSFTYKISVPEKVEGPLKLSVRLRVRHIPPHFLISVGLKDFIDKIKILDPYSHEAEIRLARR